MCRALSRMLRVVGYEVRTYGSAEALLGDPEHAHTDFVVVDVQLRGQSGFDLQEILHLELPALPVAFITAHDEQETRTKAAASGCVAYFRKPFPGAQLLNVIKLSLGPESKAVSESPRARHVSP